MHKLTDRQKAVLVYISESIQARGYPPTLREIGNHLGIRSTNGVNDHLRALERKGYLTREDMKSRTLRLMKTPDGQPSSRPPAPNDNLIEIPIVGRVAAGALSEAMLIGGQRDVFGLRVAGESMIEAGIFDGDFVFVRKQLTANRGEIIIALVGDEATCKYYYPEREHIRLQPANKDMAPILIPKNDWRTTQVLGVVVGVYRRLH
ncbi:MAG: transcriptional repressor LexA [Deltaproteobacteria bacterium]|nr:transcriptional repressor LexA [Deltaproteobacteria bacterium]